MNSSTGMPFSTWIFLNACSDICGLAAPAAAAWPCANATPGVKAEKLTVVFVGRAKEALDEWPERFIPLVRYAMLASHTIAPLHINCFHRSFIDSSCMK